MNAHSLESLARLTEAGNPAAREALEGALEPYLARIVRRALAKARPDSELTRRIHAAAQRLHPDAGSLPLEDLARQVADVLGQTLVNRAWGGGTACFEGWIDSGHNVYVVVRFQPVFAGPRQAQIKVTGSDSTNPVEFVSLTGIGTELVFEDGFENAETSEWSSCTGCPV